MQPSHDSFVRHTENKYSIRHSLPYKWINYKTTNQLRGEPATKQLRLAIHVCVRQTDHCLATTGVYTDPQALL